MIHYYVMPKELRTTSYGGTAYFPKYFGPGGPSFSATDFGGNPIMLVGVDVSDADHAILAAQPDVLAWPALDARMNQTQFDRFTTWCENNGIPSDKFSINMDSVQILKTMIKLWQFHQRLNGLGISSMGANQSRLIGSLPQGTRQIIQDAITSFGWDPQYLRDSYSLRDVAKQVADFFDRPIRFAEIS
jgi:hypothetical protein